MKILISTMPVHYNIKKGKDFISQRVAPNSAIYLLGGILRNKGYDITILDPYTIQNGGQGVSFEEVLNTYVSEANVICLSSNTLNWACTVYAISFIRKKFGDSKRIVVGGIHPTYFFEEIIKNIDVDYVLRGEGEKTIVKLMQAIEKNCGFEDIDGLVAKNMGITNKSKIKPIIDKKDYEELPLPAYDMMPDKVYHTMLIETSRGCKFNCAFCSVPHRNNWRAFEQDIVLERGKKIIELYSEKFLDKNILITDDCFTSDFCRADYIMNGLERNNSNHKFIIETRVTDWLKRDCIMGINTFTNPQIVRILFGVECGYDEGLKRISKGLTINQLESLVELLEKNNMLYKSYFSFIIGFPWEDIDDCLKTIDYAAGLVKRANRIGIVNVNWLQWYPSNLWEERKEYGIKLNSDIFSKVDYNEKFFLDLHPNLSFSDKRYIEEYIEEYENCGIFLRNG